MKEYQSYVNLLRGVVQRWLLNKVEPLDIAGVHLNGEPGTQLRKLVSISKRREAGAFFTNAQLRSCAVRQIGQTLTSTSIIIDPACGAGDLLIEATNYLEIKVTLSETLVTWNSRLRGADLVTSFVEAAKLRVILAACARGCNVDVDDIDQLLTLLTNLKVQNGLSPDMLGGVSHILLNPPFNRVPVPQNCSWAQGKANSAAVFLDKCVALSEPDTRIIAILPEVLRGGSNYAAWRRHIEERTSECHIEYFGQFDRATDVDVFVCELQIKDYTIDSGFMAPRWKLHKSATQQTVGDFFTVNVGTVVDYRDPHEGVWLPYLTAKNVTAWSTIVNTDKYRRVQTRAFQTPFVVIKRTSRNGDLHRAVAAVVNIDKQVAVDNHLLVLTPKDGSLHACEQLVDMLRQPYVTIWLNDRINCRHLTVFATQEIPWQERK